jgi:hypothetical protein
MPDALGTHQVLHDLYATTSSLVLVWADDALGTWDVYRVVTDFSFSDPPDPGTVRCDDPSVVPLAEFEVVRGDGSPRDLDAREHADARRPVGRPAVGGAEFDVAAATPVLVCIDATSVTSGWVAVQGQVIASPADFQGGAVTLEGRGSLAAGKARAGAVVAGAPGARLRVRLLADPGGNGDGSTDGSTCSARGDCPAPRGHGCGSSGGAGPIALLLSLGLLGFGPARRRARR